VILKDLNYNEKIRYNSNDIILFWQTTITQKHVYSKKEIIIHVYKQVLLFHTENGDE